MAEEEELLAKNSPTDADELRNEQHSSVEEELPHVVADANPQNEAVGESAAIGNGDFCGTCPDARTGLSSDPRTGLSSEVAPTTCPTASESSDHDSPSNDVGFDQVIPSVQILVTKEKWRDSSEESSPVVPKAVASPEASSEASPICLSSYLASPAADKPGLRKLCKKVSYQVHNDAGTPTVVKLTKLLDKTPVDGSHESVGCVDVCASALVERRPLVGNTDPVIEQTSASDWCPRRPSADVVGPIPPPLEFLEKPLGSPSVDRNLSKAFGPNDASDGVMEKFKASDGSEGATEKVSNLREGVMERVSDQPLNAIIKSSSSVILDASLQELGTF